VSYSHFWVNLFFNLKIRIDIKLNIESFIYRLDPEIKANPILLIYFEKIFHLLCNFQFNFWIINFNCEFIIETKLFRTLIKSCCHFKIKVGDCLGSYYFLLILLCKSNTIRNSSGSLYYLIDDIVTNWAILETDYVHHAIRPNRIFCCQLLID
jgi:hypothetical protein